MRWNSTGSPGLFEKVKVLNQAIQQERWQMESQMIAFITSEARVEHHVPLCRWVASDAEAEDGGG